MAGSVRPGEVKMTTDVTHVTLQYSHTIGRVEQFGTGFLLPVAMARGQGDLVYVVSSSYEHLPNSLRVTICTVEEDFIGEFGQGIPDPGPENFSAPDGSFVWPSAIAVDNEGNVYVADEWLNRISIFTKDGDWIGKWGTPGSGDGELNRPSGLAFDQDNNLYLVDSLNSRVQKFTKNGGFQANWGRAGRGEGEFNMPWGIDVDNAGYVYVADWRNDRIQKFTPDGGFMMEFGRPGTGDGEFKRPTDIAVDRDGVIYVADWLNDRIQAFGADGRFITKLTGDATISKWGKSKLDANPEMWQERARAAGLEREKFLWAPIAVNVDDEGSVFVLDSGRNRIQVYRKQSPTFVGPRL